MRRVFLVVFIAGLALGGAIAATQSSRATLREVVTALGTDVTGLSADVLAAPITSYQTLSSNGVYGLAYYEDAGDQRLHQLYLIFREPGAPWRRVALSDARIPGGAFGSATRLSITPDLVLVGAHLTPSAGLVLAVRRRDLSLAQVLSGWVVSVLPSGVVIYEESMIHFAPAHRAQLATYDPKTGQLAQLYPTGGKEPQAGDNVSFDDVNESLLRKAFVDRVRPIYAEATRRNVPPSNNGYGWDPDRFDVALDQSSLVYVPATDTLTFEVSFDTPWVPADLGPVPHLDVRVTCAPMSRPTLRCTEAAR